MRTVFQVSALKTAVLLAGAMVVGLATDSAQAVDRDPNSFVWFYSDTDASGQDSALGMSRGLAWPVIFGEFDTLVLRPTSTVQNEDEYWHSLGIGVGRNPKAASSPDGRVAGAGEQSAFIVGATGGLTFLPSDTTTVDFSPGGSPVYASRFNGTITGFSYNGFSNAIFDVAMSPFGDGGAVIGDEFYSTLTGESQEFDFNSPLQYTGFGDLTFDTQGRPHIIDDDGNIFSFDTTSASWVSARPGDAAFGTTRIAADSQGTVGAAFVEDLMGNLIYAYWTNSAGWQTTIVDTNVSADRVGLAFDYDDLPVISYTKEGSLWVAYDPIVSVPEPASLTLLAGLGLMVSARRRRG